MNPDIAITPDRDKEATLVFPHQLFRKNPALKSGRRIILVEEDLFFRQFNFNRQKLVLHRASMKFYQQFLSGMGYEVIYQETGGELSAIGALIPELSRLGITEVHYCDPVDNWLQKRLSMSCSISAISEISYQTPAFLNTLKDGADFFSTRKTYFQADYYLWQRKKHRILLEVDGKPVGGKWSFDAENRERFPPSGKVPSLSIFSPNEFVNEARMYTDLHFSENYGTTRTPFGNLVTGISPARASVARKTTAGKSTAISHFSAESPAGSLAAGISPASVAKGEGISEAFYAVTFEQADAALAGFLKERFALFGVYEDAMAGEVPVLYHSMLSPLLNTGLLTPAEVLEAALSYAADNEIPINSLEGFIRQLTGWREFIRIVYEQAGTVQRTRNYWGFSRKIPAVFWTGDTGIVPVDLVIKKSLNSGYAHHIERLMVIGNFFLLCEFDPDEVYRWFMEMYVDAYDWVMVPNVYGMTQFADGGMMTTKPYISGSNYLLKMGTWEKGSWQAIWDGLFWRFMHVHRSFFLSNPRLGMLIHTFDKMDTTKQEAHLLAAETYLSSLDLPE